MRSIAAPAHASAAAPTRVVWLPGAFHIAEDFLAAGFAEAVRVRRLALDLIFVDLELEHVEDRSALQRLRNEMVLPARSAGVSIWLGGISLGGLFALSYAAAHPDELDGLCLLAPYLGNRILTKEIAAAPGLHAWQPGRLAQTDEERRIWCYIRDRRPDSRPLYLGFGRQDRFSAAHALLAETLPADSVDMIAGGHDWPAWSQLWENFLDARFT
jgi:pimeloyl-ACP methyl ester carboxylesterase